MGSMDLPAIPLNEHLRIDRLAECSQSGICFGIVVGRIRTMVHTNVLPHVVGLLLWCLVTSSATAQSGSWVLEGWPHDKEGYFAGQTEIVADGARLKITEWPGDEAKDEEALVTWPGKTVVKVFPWNGERVGLVFEADAPLPARSDFGRKRDAALARTIPCSHQRQ